MSERRAEQHHGRVADMLVDHPAVAIDDRIDDGEETLQQSVDFLGVELRGEPRIADKVAEHDGDGPPVAAVDDGALDDGGLALADRPAAAAAIVIGGLIRIAASLAGPGERSAARGAKLAAFPVLGPTMGTAH